MEEAGVAITVVDGEGIMEEAGVAITVVDMAVVIIIIVSGRL
jgi:hypothetical protein